MLRWEKFAHKYFIGNPWPAAKIMAMCCLPDRFQNPKQTFSLTKLGE